MKPKYLITLVAVALVTMWLTVGLVIGGIIVNRSIPTSGVTSVGDLVVQGSIDWGVVDINSVVTQSGTVKNVGNVPLALSMSANTGQSWLTLDWNITTCTLQPQETIGVLWSLTVGNAPSNTPFNFDITVTGTQT